MKNTRTHLMLGFDFLSDKPCHSKRMYPNFVQYAVIDHRDGVLLVFSLFIITFFIVVLFLMFFCSYGTAGNKYLKVPEIRDSRNVQNAAYTQVRCYVCTGVAVTSELGNSKHC